jgi:hypothetical protein
VDLEIQATIRRPGVAGRAKIGLIAGTALAVCGLALASSPSSAAPAEDCAVPYPISELTDGQAVRGLTVSKGTTPEEFTGEIIGVLEDGIAPGLDMVMARLTSPEIDRVGGIWAGMSGSPVYAEDGRLIGAVAYGLAGTSPVAGITPFEDMDEYFGSSPARVASAAPAPAGGFRRLPIYTSVSGVDQTRLDQAAGHRRWLKQGIRSAGFSSSGSAADAESVVAGGNLAAALSWGDVTYAGVGTATSVCGSKVVGFGHPMLFAGKTTQALMPASAIYIQEDPSGVPFKVANLGTPVGTITDDRLTGITGSFGDLPATMTVSDVRKYQGRSRTGSSQVALKGFNAEVSFYQQLANQDRVLDGIVQGTEWVTWTVAGHDAAGNAFTLQTHDRYVSEEDISFESPWDVADQIAVLSGLRGVTIDRVDIYGSTKDDTSTYSIARVEQYIGGKWVRVHSGRSILGVAGKTLAVRTVLRSDTATKTVLTAVRVPAGAYGAVGEYVVGDADAGEFDEEPVYPSGSLAAVLAYYRSWVGNDQVSGSLFLENDEQEFKPVRFHSGVTDKVIVGEATIPVRIR